MPSKNRNRVRRKTNKTKTKSKSKFFNLKGLFNFLKTRKKRVNKRKKQSGG